MTGVVGSPYATDPGTSWRYSASREHAVEQSSRGVAVVSDRGVKRERNDDAATVVAEGSWAALVVCDGVGSTRGGDRAALAASQDGRTALVAAMRDGKSLEEQVVAAFGAAGRTVEGIPEDPAVGGGSAPATTFVAAVTDGSDIVLASAGDSRAYWVPDGGVAEQLSQDDSWAAAQIALGFPADVVHTLPMAHVITRWLGRSRAGIEPNIATRTVAGPGWLLLCSDGLWNYLPPAWFVSRRAAQPGADALALAEEMVGWANSQGGADNITVALARIEGAARIDGATG